MYVCVHVYVCMYVFVQRSAFSRMRDSRFCREEEFHTALYVCVCVCMYVCVHRSAFRGVRDSHTLSAERKNYTLRCMYACIHARVGKSDWRSVATRNCALCVNVCIVLYVCMYAFMHICMYAFMHVSVSVRWTWTGQTNMMILILFIMIDLFLAKKENIVVPNAVEKSRTGALRSQDQTLSFFLRPKKKQSLWKWEY
jgi:hypothetical protein